MAKPMRGGLGRGLTSLMGGNDKSNPEKRTSNRETIRYNEREDVVYDENGNQTKVEADTVNKTDIPEKKQQKHEVSIRETLNSEDVSRETSKTDSFKSTDLIAENKDEEPIKEATHQSIENESVKIPEPPEVPTSLKKEEALKQTIDSNEYGSTSEKNIEEEIDIEVVSDSADNKNFGENRANGIITTEVDIDLVQPNPEQPRTNFDEDELKELSESIKRNGLIQPILVRTNNDGTYQIIAGERRWQASKLAGIDRIQVNIKDVDDKKALEYALIENIQRSDLNPIEEAYGYKRLMERNKMTQADIAQAVSKARSTIANTLRLLELPEEAQQLLFEEKITAGHARAILSVVSREDRLKLTHKLLENNMTVREAEAYASQLNNGPAKKTERTPQPAVYKSVARALKSALDAPVKIKTSKGKNRIEIEFNDEKDLERLFELINPE